MIKFRFKKTRLSRRVDFILVILIAVFSFIGIYTNANAQPQPGTRPADFARIEGVSSSNTSRVAVRWPSVSAQNQVLRNRSRFLWFNAVSAVNRNWANIAMIGRNGIPVFAVSAHSDSRSQLEYRYPCNAQAPDGYGTFTVGKRQASSSNPRDAECEYRVPAALKSVTKVEPLAKQTRPPVEAIPQPQPQPQPQSSVIVQMNTEQATLYQVRYLGDRLAIDVIRGTISVRTLEGEDRIEEGNSYVYIFYSGLRGQQRQGINPDQAAIEIFLDPSLWSSTSSEISSLRQEINYAATGFRIVETMLRADPFNYVGTCPVRITFTGRISTAGGAGQVSYRFIRSDRASAPIQTINLDGPGSRDVSTTWTLGAPGMNFSGWQSIQTFDPQETTSNRADFSIRCTSTTPSSTSPSRVDPLVIP